MATKMGAAGVRIELKDNSAYSVITTPKATAGIVGFAPKGEMNKIQRLTNTAAQDTYFGLGFNNSRYNQGMYAARAVLDAGGYVEYIRPYGEEIDTSDPWKRDLKTDAFIVSFDRDAMNVTKEKDSTGEFVGKYNADHTSLQLEYFASTRYKTDGASLYGVTRKINNIAEAVAKNNNVDFNVDAADDYAERSARSRGATDIVLFALMSADPSSAHRAYTSYTVTAINDRNDSSSKEFVVECATNPAFISGTVLYAPVLKNSTDSTLYSYVVTNVVDRKVHLVANDTATETAAAKGYKPTVLFHYDEENAVADGCDYVSVKTAVAGRGSKLFGAITVDDSSVEQLAELADGQGFTVYDSNCAAHEIRFNTGTAVTAAVEFTGTGDAGTVAQKESVKVSMGTNKPNFLVDEDILLATKVMVEKEIDDESGTGKTIVEVEVDTSAVYRVTGITEVPANGTAPASYTVNAVYVSAKDEYFVPKAADGSEYDLTIYGFITESIVKVTATSTAKEVATDIAACLAASPFKLGSSARVTDIGNEDIGDTAPFSASSPDIYVTKGTVFDFQAGDQVAIVRGSGSSVAIGDVTKAGSIVTMGTVVEVDGYLSRVILENNVGVDVVDGEKYQLVNLTTTSLSTFVTTTSAIITPAVPAVVDESGNVITPAIEAETSEIADIFIVGNYVNTVTMDTQRETAPVDLGVCADALTYTTMGGNHIIETSEKVLMDSSVGATFVGLGLATIQYLDVNYTGKAIKVYDLTDEGEAIARLYLAVDYKYAGTLYEFEGTIVPYVYNGLQLSLADAASAELDGTGVKFMLNDNGVLDMFLEDNSYDLSGTVTNGKPSSISTAVSFNVNDPAVVQNAVWSYNPQNNLSTSTIATAYSLFLDKDNSDVSFIVGAGMGVNNFGLKSYETLNTTVMQAVLNICELRKDCFALFDGVNERDIEKALKKDILAARFPSTLGRWGAIYDARPVFYDSIVTLTNVEVAPSVAMASLITANRSDNIFWRPPAGKENGVVPSAWCTNVRNKRQFSYPEDPDSDIARLSDIHVNPFRTTNDGMWVWMDYTMQMEDSAFNQIHVAMLIAGIHKIFYHYLDGMVFQLNTPALRSQIQGNIQAQLDLITASNPSGFEEAHCICDETNNTADVINQNKLYVDLKLKPTKSIRFITLRTEVQSSGDGNTVSTTMN